VLAEVAKAIGPGSAWRIGGRIGGIGDDIGWRVGGIGDDIGMWIGGIGDGVGGRWNEAKEPGGGVGDEDKGDEDEESEAEAIEEDEEGVFPGEIVFRNEEEIIGIKNTQHEYVDDEIALGRRIGQVCPEGEGFGGKEDGQGQEEYASCEVEQ